MVTKCFLMRRVLSLVWRQGWCPVEPALWNSDAVDYLWQLVQMWAWDQETPITSHWRSQAGDWKLFENSVWKIVNLILKDLDGQQDWHLGYFSGAFLCPLWPLPPQVIWTGSFSQRYHCLGVLCWWLQVFPFYPVSFLPACLEFLFSSLSPYPSYVAIYFTRDKCLLLQK